jgi:antitoxin ParD1/3/4
MKNFVAKVAALRLLEGSERRQVVQLQALRADMASGRASGPARPAKAVFDRLQAKYAQKTKGKSR